MTWFKHRCWFCGRKSKEVIYIVGDHNYQCVDKDACLKRKYKQAGLL